MSAVKREELLPDKVRCYIKEHRIDEVLTSTLNGVIQAMPEDPLSHMAEELAKHCGSSPHFAPFHWDPGAPRGELRFDMPVTSRGARVRVHSVSLSGVLFAGEPVEEEVGAGSDPNRKSRHQAQEAKLVAFLEEFFAEAFGERSVDDFLDLHEQCEGLARAPIPGAGLTVDLPRATAHLAEEVLVAAARSLDATRLAFLQRVLTRASPVHSCLASPPLRGLDDLAAWRARWPRLAMPVFHGGSPSVLRPASLRCCAAFSPFTAGPVADSDVPADCPPLGWVATVVQALRGAAAEAVKGLQADKTTAALAVNGVAYGHPAGLAQTLRLAKKAAEAAAGSGNEAEVSGVLLACADEAWIEDEGVYEVESGKKLSLEQLVDLYAELAEDGWLRMVVQPFRQADTLEGCELLQARRPELRLVLDPGEGAEPPEPTKDGAFSCALHIAESVPRTLQRYTEFAPLWSKEAAGFARCTILGAQAAATVPSALCAALACRESEVVCLARDVSDADVARMSEYVNEALFRVLFPDDDAA